MNQNKKRWFFYRHVFLALAVCFATLFITGCPPWPPHGPSNPPPCYDFSLRLMTYNLAMLATMDSNEDIYLMDDIDRANLIADEILKTQYDVIVFQEVFKDDGKQALAAKLSGTYPHYVYKLDAHDLDQDSGLMLFSRYPFAKLPKDTHKADDVTAVSYSSPNGIWEDVAFIEYDDYQGDDGWANKGAAMVRIKIPCVNKFVNIAFSHLQASYDDDSNTEAAMAVVIRKKQLQDVKKVIEETLTPEQLTKEQIYFMGDLNIDGNLFDLKPLPGSGKSEWSERFDSSEFFATKLKDGWAFQTSKDDPGQTAGSGFPYFPDGNTQGERLDYILYNPTATVELDGLLYMETPIRIQHIRKAWELSLDDGEHLTDHLGVTADINIETSYSNPLTAYGVAPNPDQEVQGNLQFKGSMEWYRIDEPGSYSIRISSAGNNAKYDVYESDDLSRPIGNYHGEVTEWGPKFVMPEAPFYIRVYASDRSWTGDYWIRFHKHMGGGYFDSITLLPARAETYTISSIPLNQDNAVWFDFHTDVSDNDEMPQLQFMLDATEDIFKFNLLDENRNQLSQASDITLNTTSTGYEWHMRRDDFKAGKYYLVVLPTITTPAGKDFSVEWRTNLTYFIAKQMKCDIQDDTFGDDTIWALMKVDPASTGYHAYPLGDFDEGTDKQGINMGGVRKFLDNIWIYLCEIDCQLDNPAWTTPGVLHTQFTVTSDPAGCGDDWWGQKFIYSIPPEEYMSRQPHIIWKDGDTYEYYFLYQLARDSADIQ